MSAAGCLGCHCQKTSLGAGSGIVKKNDVALRTQSRTIINVNFELNFFKILGTCLQLSGLSLSKNQLGCWFR